MASPSLADRPVAVDWRPLPFRVTGRRQETPDTWTLELRGDRPLPFEPGQFTMLAAGGHGEVPISISGDPADPGRLVHTVRAVGLATSAICATEPGQVLGVRGPFGRGWPLEKAGDLLVVAGGIGLAPLRGALYAALGSREHFDRVVLLYGGREPDLLLYKDELAAWEQGDALDVELTVDAADRGWRQAVGVVPRLVERAAFDAARSVALVVGPEVMMRFTVAALLARGVPPERIYLSLERNMQCGVGQCGHCQLGSVLVCRDGPVFSHAEIGAAMAVREL
jgi:NAD(P)H-flavin reductase